jgi:signal transduction histidine kinase
LPPRDDQRIIRRKAPEARVVLVGATVPEAHQDGFAEPAPGPQRIFRFDGPRDEPFIVGDFKVAIHQDAGRWTVVEPKPAIRFDSWQQRILLILALSVLCVSPLAWLFARRLSGPISAFAGAAERLGRDPRAAPLALKGSSEVIAAANAFNMMQERLRRYVEDRTAMIGAVAHDLRTPLTRLRFRIEAVPEDVRVKLASDIDQMEAMIAATMAFVRDTSRPAERTKLELASLLESIIDEAAETGGQASVELGEKIIIDGDPVALRRLLTNLVENGLKYGGAVQGRVRAEGPPGGDRDRRQRPRHRSGRVGQRVRAVLPQRALAQSRNGRDRTGPGGRPLGGPRPRRRRHPAQPSRGRTAGPGRTAVLGRIRNRQGSRRFVSTAQKLRHTHDMRAGLIKRCKLQPPPRHLHSDVRRPVPGRLRVRSAAGRSARRLGQSAPRPAPARRRRGRRTAAPPRRSLFISPAGEPFPRRARRALPRRRLVRRRRRRP